jgi:hypothetical protein
MVCTWHVPGTGLAPLRRRSAADLLLGANWSWFVAARSWHVSCELAKVMLVLDNDDHKGSSKWEA